MQKSKFQYTQEQWEEEMIKVRFCGKHPPFGACNLVCPNCGVRGFYAPRGRNPEVRRYRACKFCGFWQEVSGRIYDEKGGEPYRCVMIQCNNCGLYSWRVPWSDDWGQCEKCNSKDLKQVQWPTEDPLHPFHQIRAQMDKIHNLLTKNE